METSASTRPSSPPPFVSSASSRTRTRFLLKCTATQLWLADQTLIDDKSELYTLHAQEALQFTTPEAAAQRARLLLTVIPDITIDAVQVPWRHG
jgi:hypothetical protein